MARLKEMSVSQSDCIESDVMVIGEYWETDK